MKNFKNWNIAVIGAGTMGLCIAEHFATQGHKTSLCGYSENGLKKAEQQIINNLNAIRQNGIIEADEIENILGRLSFTGKLEEAVKEADIVIEAVPEVIETKKEVFEKLFQYAPDHTFLCSTTSGLNVYEHIDVKKPERVIITHFFNPAHLMPLVEVVKGEMTPNDTAITIRDFLVSTGKKPIIINKVVQGFVFNRIIMAMELEAFHLVEQGVVTYKDIDDVITSTLGPRFIFEGVFALIDHCGLDTEALILKDLIPQLWKGNDVPKSLIERVNNGEYGLKTGKGFGDYSRQDANELRRVRTINIMKSLEFQKSLKG